MINNQERTKQILKDRKFVSCVLDNEKVYYLDYNALEDSNQLNKNQKIIKGISASKGIVKGIAKLVLSNRDFKSFNQGEILVAEMTRPDFLPVMRKASAIITDEGGLTCHAAIVARELGIPCIIGTKIATRILKDNQEVEVDANKGIVTILERSE